MPVGDLTALVATTLAVVALYPQMCRLRRNRDMAGVSLAAATLGVATEVGWFCYTLEGELWAAVPEAAIMAGSNVLLAIVIVRVGAPPGRSIAVAVVWGSALGGAMLAGGFTLVGSLLGLAYGVECAPAVWTAYRTRVPSGLAPATWVMTLLEAWLWGCYGAVNEDIGLLAFGIIGTIASSAVLARWFVTRGRTTSLAVSAASRR